MVRFHCTYPSFMCRRSCIAASDAGQTEKPLREIAGAFLRFSGTAEQPTVKSTIPTR
jgi:hypothetical protein